MIRMLTATVVVLGLLTAPVPAFAQSDDDPNFADGPPRATKVPTEGFWPTKRMLEHIIDRMLDEMSDHYELDEDQYQQTREMFQERIPQFMNDNRAEIQTLVNQFFEAQLDDEPPAIDAVATWAQRVQPLLEQVGELSEEIVTDMSQYFNDDQVTMLEAEYAAFQTGMGLAQSRLAVWADGGYDPETEWVSPGSERRKRDRERRRETREAMEEAREQVIEGGATAEEAAATATEKTIERRAETNQPKKDDWTLYTERFIRAYQLNTEQRQKANAYLRRQQEERDRYLRRNAREMEKVTTLLQGAESEPQRKKALAAYDKINEPIDRMFAQLKERLQTLPTRAQRRQALETGSAEEFEKERRDAASRPAKRARETTEAETVSEDEPAEETPSETPPPAAEDQ